MKYESKNAIGFALLFLSGLLAIGALLLLTNPWATIAVVLALVMAGGGFYLMTRAFTTVDRNHPDYERYMERFYGDDAAGDDTGP